MTEERSFCLQARVLSCCFRSILLTERFCLVDRQGMLEQAARTASPAAKKAAASAERMGVLDQGVMGASVPRVVVNGAAA